MFRHEARAVLCAALAAAFVSGCRSHRTETAPTTSTAAAGFDPSGIDSTDIARSAGGASVQKLLEGKVSGVTVNEAADGSISVRIRGATSFYAGSEPLYILDGVPYQPGPSGSLKGINPHDIESIKVLKDPADISLYGVRGGNGVIVITTKRPVKQS
jgi:TonB-dependent SusC/RagA subfamily outer membrane receptor